MFNHKACIQKKYKLKKRALTFLVFCVVLGLLSLIPYARSLPSGSSVDEQKSEREIPDAPGTIQAQAGNVTEIDIYGVSITRSWQGYFGNVSGVIVLEDANNNTLYNWSLASPEGEVYAANNTITWTNIQCFNYTATGLESTDYNYTEDIEYARGGTSRYGKNLSDLETEFGIIYDDVDGVNETFKNGTACEGCLAGGWNDEAHDLFYVSYLEFSPGECLYTRLFNDAGEGTDNEFEEVLLWDPDGNNTVYTSLLEEDMLGFDQTPKDFEMIVLENGHGTDTATTQYYFYVEIE